MEQPVPPTDERSSAFASGVSLHAADESDYESRILLVERSTDESPHGSGWYRTEGSTSGEGRKVWLRVLRELPHSEIVETLTLDEGEPAPTAPGWLPTDPGTTWSQRFIWRYGDEEPDADSEASPATPTSGPPAVGSSSYAPPTGPTHPVTGNSLRAWLTLALTAAIVVVVLIGLLMKVPAQSFTTYIAPLSALAGTALGFWFGSEAHRW